MEQNRKLLSIHPLLAFVTPFPELLNGTSLEGNAINGRNQSSCSFPPLLTPFPVIVFTDEEATDCTNE